MSPGAKRSCTSQAPGWVITLTPVWRATFAARYWSGIMITSGTPRLSMTLTALPEVQQMSLSAFTAAEVFT